jgi:hypothetical protein
MIRLRLDAELIENARGDVVLAMGSFEGTVVSVQMKRNDIRSWIKIGEGYDGTSCSVCECEGSRVGEGPAPSL